ncbi:maleylacetate reductase, partial [Arthrobacter crystallopoietes BAB-32]
VEKAEKARAAAAEHGIDLLVCVGGGSTTGLAKAIALTTGIPIVAVPTTYAGSEATNVWGLTEAARKTTGVDDKVLPATVIYDAALTLSLPVDLSVASGLNGMAHCIDSMWGPRADPINQALGAEGIRALNQGLPLITQDPARLDGREQALYGAYLSAVAFASAGSGMHHKICHVLGGTWNMPHAQTHATVLPYVLAFNAPAAPAATERIAAAFGTENPVDGLNRLRETLNAPKALKDYGFAEENIAEAVELILPVIPASNPRTATPENLTALLAAATAGDDPKTLTDL